MYATILIVSPACSPISTSLRAHSDVPPESGMVKPWARRLVAAKNDATTTTMNKHNPNLVNPSALLILFTSIFLRLSAVAQPTDRFPLPWSRGSSALQINCPRLIVQHVLNGPQSLASYKFRAEPNAPASPDNIRNTVNKHTTTSSELGS